MLKKSSAFSEKSNPPEDKKKRAKIQWDEVTIAEHDKERGSRQKIDEAPTPYRYMSESEQSEGEYSSDGEHLARSKAGTIADSWEALHAKLQYEKHLQDMQQDLTYNRHGGGHPTTPGGDQEMTYDYSSSHDTNTGDEMSVGANDPQTTEFGEVLPTKTETPIRSAIKKSSNTPSGAAAPSSSSASSIAVSLSGSGNNLMVGAMTSPKPKNRSSSEKPRKSVHIKGAEGGGGTSTNQTAHPTTPAFSNSSNYWGNSHAFSSSTSPNTTPVASNGATKNLFAGINGSIGGDGDEDQAAGKTTDMIPPEQKEQFKRKRAGHYNEFKVLQAMRAKMRDEEDDDDEEADEDDDYEARRARTGSGGSSAGVGGAGGGSSSGSRFGGPPAFTRQRSLEKVNSLQPTTPGQHQSHHHHHHPHNPSLPSVTQSLPAPAPLPPVPSAVVTPPSAPESQTNVIPMDEEP